MPKKLKIVCIKGHGACYAIEEGELVYTRMTKGGLPSSTNPDDGWGTVEEAPKREKAGHIKALKQLGLSQDQIEKALSKVAYY